MELRQEILNNLCHSKLTVDEINRIEMWLNKLIENDLFLHCLYESDVESWEGYEKAEEKFMEIKNGRN